MSLLGGQSWDLLEDAGLWKCDKERRKTSRRETGHGSFHNITGVIGKD